MLAHPPRLRHLRASGADSLWWARAVLALLAFAPLLAQVGWREQTTLERFGVDIRLAALVLYALTLLVDSGRGASGWARAVLQTARLRPYESCLVLGGLLAHTWPVIESVCIVALLLLNILRSYARLLRAGVPPNLVFVGSFVALCLVGAGGLMLPVATPPESPISGLDALFTSTSAVCVTGLIVRDTATEFTRFGQAVILALIQLGGLGILFFGAMLAITLGSNIGLRTADALRTTPDQGLSAQGLRRLLVFVVVVTIAVEGLGAAALYAGWPDDWAASHGIESGADRAFHSLFFSVSALCNAGFATTSDSLHGLRTHWTSHIVMAGLIVVGGLGYPVLLNIARVFRERVRRRRPDRRAGSRLNLHTKLVLVTTLVLYALGLLGMFAARTLHDSQPMGASLLDAHFFSVTARTAGFDTVAPSEVGPLGRFVLIFLMFIGGSPGSTAGGVKTIVVAVLFLTVWSTIRGRKATEAFRREIPEDSVRRAATLIVLGLASIVAVASALMMLEGSRVAFDDALFEAVSTCGTVGLSTGITGDLSDASKATVVLGMLLGRVGPLAVIFALTEVTSRRRPSYAYPTEHVVMS